jgi:hypothetical protein
METLNQKIKEILKELGFSGTEKHLKVTYKIKNFGFSSQEILIKINN